MTSEELMKKIEKEEKWLIHALNDQTDVTSQYSVDIAFDAVKHYVKDYIDSQQRTGRWIDDEFGSKCSCCGIYTHLDRFDMPMKSKCCSMCGAKMESEDEEQ